MLNFIVTASLTSTSRPQLTSLLRRTCTPLHSSRWHVDPSPAAGRLPTRPVPRRTCTIMARPGKGAGKGAGVAPPSTGVNDANAYDHATEKLVAYCVNQCVDRDVALRVLAMAQRSVRDWTVSASDFLTPPESAALETAVLTMADACAVSWGGYEDAERRVLFVAHAETVPDTDGLKQLAGEQLVLLKIMGNFEFDKASHRDFMGAVLNAGISRQKIGDIVVQGQSGAHVIVHQEIASFLQTSVTTVRNVNVSVDVTSVDELQLSPKRIKEIQSVESSMRMDAVISAGFNISRSKLADMARSGLVSVNYKELRSPAKTVKSGDVVSVRGVGKLEIGECSTTAKGRYRIEMKKYV